MFTLSLAWRYATRRFVNAVAVAAIAVALTVQIVAGAILDGMVEGQRVRIRGMGGQVGVAFGAPSLPFSIYEAVAADLIRSHPDDLVGVTPFLRRYAIINRRDGRVYGEVVPCTVSCIDLAGEIRVSRLADHLLTLRLDPENPSWFAPGTPPDKRAPLFMGASLAEKLSVAPGDEIELVHARENADGKFEPVTGLFVLTSLFRSGNVFQDHGVWIPLSEGAPFFLRGGRRTAEDAAGRPNVPELACWLVDPDRAAELEPVLRATVDRSLDRLGWRRSMDSSNWQTRFAELFSAMENENRLVELVLMLFIISGGLCVFAILSTLASRRMRDVGLLRCLGAGRGMIAATFLLVGLWLGTAAAAFGTAGGLWLLHPERGGHPTRARVDVYYEKATGQPMYPPELYGDYMPVVVRADKIAFYAAGALLVAMAAALYPALWAAAREPVAALRDE